MRRAAEWRRVLSASPVPRRLRMADNTSIHSSYRWKETSLWCLSSNLVGAAFCQQGHAAKRPGPKPNLAIRDDKDGRLLLFTQSHANTSHSASLSPLKIGITGMGMQAIIYSKQCLWLLTSLPVAFGIKPTCPKLTAALISCGLGCRVRRGKIGKKDKDSEVPQDHSAHKSLCLVPGPVHRTIDLEGSMQMCPFPITERDLYD